jgi:predicted dehydrogenase
MAPIRVGLIGLGPVSSEGYRPGEWGIQHMNAINSSPYFELVAVANSSVESAQRSIDSHKLPSTVKAYGSPQDIASDPRVDLIAVAVNINRHYELVKPAILAKKNILAEFPFMPKVEQTEELVDLAKANGVKVVVAAQARADPAVLKLKEIIQSKAIGDVVHSQFTAQNPMGTPPMWPESTAGFFDIDAGISRVNILLGHGTFPLDARK